MPITPLVSLYSREIQLSEDHLNMLKRHIADFRKSDLDRRWGIVKICVEWIQAWWHGAAEFDYDEVKKVRSL